MTGLLTRPADPVPAGVPVPGVAGVRLRPAGPDDGEPVRAFLAGLSLDSAYRRFFTGIGTPSAALVRRLLDAEPGRRTVVLAVAGTEVVGLADSTLLDGGRAVELGVVVADRWQRRGLGWPLCEAALGPALALGTAVLRAHSLPDNSRVARMLRRAWPAGAPRYADGTLLWELPLQDLAGPAARER